MQAAGEAEEPEEAMRESARPASLVTILCLIPSDLESIFNRY